MPSSMCALNGNGLIPRSRRARIYATQTNCNGRGMYKWARATLGTTMNGSIENGFMRPTRVPYKVLYALLFTLLVVLIVLLLPGDLRAGGQGSDSPVVLLQEDLGQLEYNTTYPLTRPKGTVIAAAGIVDSIVWVMVWVLEVSVMATTGVCAVWVLIN